MLNSSLREVEIQRYVPPSERTRCAYRERKNGERSPNYAASSDHVITSYDCEPVPNPITPQVKVFSNPEYYFAYLLWFWLNGTMCNYAVMGFIDKG